MQFCHSPRPLWLPAGLLLLALCVPPALAGVIIDGTRVIYPAKDREVIVRLTNKGEMPVLMQVWADRGNEHSQPQTADAPFLLTPPIFRLDPKKGQAVRVVFTGDGLPEDRESLFWFNSLEIPSMPKDGGNYMQIAVQSRLKLFYRPAGLSEPLERAITRIRWSLRQEGKAYVLQAENPTPYHLTLTDIALRQQGHDYKAVGSMIPPFASRDFTVAGLGSAAPGGELRFGWLSDFGFGPEQRVRLP